MASNRIRRRLNKSINKKFNRKFFGNRSKKKTTKYLKYRKT